MIKELIKRHREELGYSVTQLAGKIGVHPSTLSKWEKGVTEPSEMYVDKVTRALGLKNGSLTPTKLKGKTRITLTDDFYYILHKLEREFESCSYVPEDDPRLRQLRIMMGVETLESHGYNKEKVDQLRVERNITRRGLSLALGRSMSWFSGSFMKGRKVFTEQEAEMFAEFFEVDIKEFEE